MTHRDRAGDASGHPAGHRAGRREAAGDAGHRQGFPTPAPIRPLPCRLNWYMPAISQPPTPGQRNRIVRPRNYLEPN